MTTKQLFDPPLWMQRRTLALLILKDFNIKTVIDAGCGEGAMLEVLKNGFFDKIAGFDIGIEGVEMDLTFCILDDGCIELAKLASQPNEYDLRFLRESKATVDIYKGSVSEIDERLLNYDGIVSLEVIEHLCPNELLLFPKVTLGELCAYNPKVMIVSTPNAEFNVHFPNLKYGSKESQFRHYDHKFEWTRLEFNEWANEQALTYGYQVCFSGVGLLKSDDDFGYCTQFGIFLRNDLVGLEYKKNNITIPSSSNPYELSETIHLPFYEVCEAQDDYLFKELEEQFYYLSFEGKSVTKIDNFSANDAMDTTNGNVVVIRMCVQLERIWTKLRVRQLFKSSENLVSFLSKKSNNFEVLEDLSRSDLAVLKKEGFFLMRKEKDCMRTLNEKVWLHYLEKERESDLYIKACFTIEEKCIEDNEIEEEKAFDYFA
ncbi:Small RNA 2'-O-methyltransferase [Lobulomyces angularis]|nr:Small RNA 2'-O-methyltransferase [Lobulomyces angularis]